MFNNSDELKVSEIADETEIEHDNDYLQKVISVLLKSKILQVKNRQLVDDEFVKLEDTLVCYDKYSKSGLVISWQWATLSAQF